MAKKLKAADFKVMSPEEIENLNAKDKVAYDKWAAGQEPDELEVGDVEPPKQTELFGLHRLKRGVPYIDIPYLKDGKVEWVHTTASMFDEKAQNAIFDYWNRRKKEDGDFDIEAKKQKFFARSAKDGDFILEDFEVAKENQDA